MRSMTLAGLFASGLMIMALGCSAARPVPVPEPERWSGKKNIIFPATMPHMTVVRDETDPVQRAAWARELLRRGTSKTAAEEYERLALEYKTEDQEFEREAFRMAAVAWLQAGEVKRFLRATDQLAALNDRYRAATPTPETAALICLRDRLRGQVPPEHVRRVLPAKIRNLMK